MRSSYRFRYYSGQCDTSFHHYKLQDFILLCILCAYTSTMWRLDGVHMTVTVYSLGPGDRREPSHWELMWICYRLLLDMGKLYT